MAVGTAAALTGGLGLGLSAFQAISGEKRRSEAMKELNNYDRQVLDNAFKDIPLFTEGIDLQRDENARTSANLVDAASNAGSRAIIGAAPRISAATNDLNAEIAANLDNQAMRRAYAIANDNARIEGITENRDNANISALASQANAGRQDFWDGIMGAASSGAYLSRGITSSPNAPVQALDASGAPGVTTLPTTPITATPLSTNPYPAAGTNYAPMQYPSPNFDFANSYTPEVNTVGPNQYNPFFNFSTSYNGY